MIINTKEWPLPDELESDTYGGDSGSSDDGQGDLRFERSAPNVMRPTVYCPETNREECLEEHGG
jgi:hypothetical protein